MFFGRGISWVFFEGGFEILNIFVIGRYNVRDKRSFRSAAKKIWENCEPSNFPFIPCYVPQRLKGGERSVVRPKGESPP